MVTLSCFEDFLSCGWRSYKMTDSRSKVQCDKAKTCLSEYSCHHKKPHAPDKRCDYGYCGQTDQPKNKCGGTNG